MLTSDETVSLRTVPRQVQDAWQHDACEVLTARSSSRALGICFGRLLVSSGRYIVSVAPVSARSTLSERVV